MLLLTNNLVLLQLGKRWKKRRERCCKKSSIGDSNRKSPASYSQAKFHNNIGGSSISSSGKSHRQTRLMIKQKSTPSQDNSSMRLISIVLLTTSPSKVKSRRKMSHKTLLAALEANLLSNVINKRSRGRQLSKVRL